MARIVKVELKKSVFLVHCVNSIVRIFVCLHHPQIIKFQSENFPERPHLWKKFLLLIYSGSYFLSVVLEFLFLDHHRGICQYLVTVLPTYLRSVPFVYCVFLLFFQKRYIK